MDHPWTVLFLCTHNSARSILAERILEAIGGGRFSGVSAGSHPRGAPHPLALRLLREQGLPTEGLRSKSWDEFVAPGAPPLDFVFTVCDQAAGEVCPVWPDQPVTAHWGLPDPSAINGGKAQCMLAFRETYAVLDRRLQVFAALPVASLDRLTLTRKAGEIGRLGGTAHGAAA